jgi:hypothetical protein
MIVRNASLLVPTNRKRVTDQATTLMVEMVDGQGKQPTCASNQRRRRQAMPAFKTLNR